MGALLGVVLVGAICLGQSLAVAALGPPEEMLPKAAGHWSLVRTMVLREAQEMFDYMDGAAELYLAYDFRGLRVGKYASSGEEPEMIVELYQFGAAPEACGVLLDDMPGQEVGIGQASSYAHGLLKFWKGRFFVRVLDWVGTEESQAAAQALAREVAGRIEETGSEPALLAALPYRHRAPNTTHYLHTKMCLDWHYYLGTENVFGLSRETEVATASYRFEGEKAILVVVRYPSEGECWEAFCRFMQVHLGASPEGAGRMVVVQTGDGKWAGASRLGRFLFAVLEAPTQQHCRRLIGIARGRARRLESQ